MILFALCLYVRIASSFLANPFANPKLFRSEGERRNFLAFLSFDIYFAPFLRLVRWLTAALLDVSVKIEFRDFGEMGFRP